MNKVIEEIVIADEQARKDLQIAKDRKNEIKKLAEIKKIEIQNKYMNFANAQIEKSKNEDLKKAKADIKNNEKMYDGLLQKIDISYKKNSDNWAESICKNVIKNFSGE